MREKTATARENEGRILNRGREKGSKCNIGEKLGTEGFMAVQC